MKPYIKRKWVNALRSEEYKQTTDKLYSSLENAHCCLGVLRKEVNGRNKGGDVGNHILSDHFLKKVGLSVGVQQKLADFNDGNGTKQRSFKWIAYYIDRYL